MKERANESEILTLIKKNIRDYAMYIALVAIFVYFSYKTDGLFLTSGNITNLINQTGYVAVLAIGMTLVLIVRHIDLSVGYVAGFLGAVAAILMTQQGWSEWIVIPVVLLLGLLIGVYQGTLIAYVGVPAFVTTLAGMFIFRGILSLSLKSTGTIIVPNEGFNDLSNEFVPDIPNTFGFHLITLLIGLVAIWVLIMTQIRVRKNKIKYNFQVVSSPIFTAKLILMSAILLVVIMVLAMDQGIPWTAVIVGVVLIGYNFMLNKTRLGRYIYGIGGNPEAAELSGVDVKKVTMFVFCSMSTLAALSGILFTARLKSATPTAGLAFEMDAIASCYIGGVSVKGGVGKVTNTMIGALIIMSLTNGMNLMGTDIAYQYVVKGIIFILAVAFDIKTRKVA
jgi:putative multiple sugar transport system permease protein